jgi:hypothetical protein
MINLEGKTKLSSEEVKKRVKQFFGKGGQGLELTEEDPQCLTFSGGGGFVTATVCPEGGETKVNLLAQEWEYQSKEFLSSLP